MAGIKVISKVLDITSTNALGVKITTLYDETGFFSINVHIELRQPMQLLRAPDIVFINNMRKFFCSSSWGEKNRIHTGRYKRPSG